METFTASNGMQLRTDEGGWLERCNRGQLGTGEWGKLNQLNAKAPSLVWDALREFFQYERDQELGRWRWPENPDYVVVQDHSPERYVVVMRDSTGSTYGVGEGDQPSADIPWRDCARAYFAAHPVPKPWHDAKPGEVWLLTFLSGEQMIGLVDHDGECFIGGGQELTVIKSTAFTAGRRIWPEVE